MKLLHICEFHANRRGFNWTLDHADEFDLIAHTGDFLDVHEAESLGENVRRFDSDPRFHSQISKSVIVIKLCGVCGAQPLQNKDSHRC
jgi:predicted phosphodiesterase